jgi:glycosyltransferase involved in cell wall biosynthesis
MRAVTPQITVITPSHNDGPLLREAVDSLRAAEGIELVVVDDASTDPETLEIMAELEAQGTRVVHHQENKRLAEARNTGLAATSAPYVFPLDADDLAAPGALKTMLARLEAAPEADVCFGDYLEFGPYELVRRVPHEIDPYRLAYRNEFPVAALFRRSVLESVGGWTDLGDPIGYEDWDLWLKLAEGGHRGVHAGDGLLTFRKRTREGSMLNATRDGHNTLYRTIKERHPGIFDSIPRLRRESNLSPVKARMYPFLFGARPRPAFERRLKLWYYKRRWGSPEGSPISS